MGKASNAGTGNWVRQFPAMLVLLLPLPALAQRVTVAIQDGPYYTGDPVVVRVTAEDFDESPQPDCELQGVSEGLSVKLVNVSPSRNSYVQIINGKRTEYTSVKFNFDYHVVAANPGAYSVTGFKVSQGAKQAGGRGLKIQFNEVELDKDMRISLILPQNPIYPGQRVPVTMEWWYAGSLDAIASISFRSPLFERFTFVDEPAGQGDTTIPITVGMETIRLKAQVEKRTLDGREYTVISVRRTLIPDKPGRYDLEPITVSLEKTTRWTRDMFGRRRPAETKRVRAVGKPLTVTIKSLPLDEAPPGFAGAVGRGFSIDVSADRTVVHVGDPIGLAITLRGDGNLDSAGLASLGYEGGLDPDRFRSPSGDATGVMAEDGRSKRFDITVRVLDASVKQIPPITYAWFDPEQGQYQTSQSSPVALQVLPAQMIGAKDVVGSTESPGDADVGAPGENKTPERTDDLVGADLTIETDTGRLTSGHSRILGSVGAQVTAYGASFVLVLVAWWRRKAADVDPALIERRRVIQQQLKQIRETAHIPRQEAAQQIANACRRLIPHVDHEHRQGIDKIISECDALAFAPGEGERRPVDEDLRRLAIELAQGIARSES